MSLRRVAAGAVGRKLAYVATNSMKHTISRSVVGREGRTASDRCNLRLCMLVFQAFTDCYRIHQLEPLACIDNLDQYRSLCCVKRERMHGQ